MKSNKEKIVTEYANMWPREVFYMLGPNNKLRTQGEGFEHLQKPGVYILYRDDQPYYIGKTNRSLFSRLHAHANLSSDRYYNFWNYFSVFVVPDKSHVDEVEGILIASMTTANSAVPKIKRIRLPANVAKILRDARRREFQSK